MLIVLTTAEGCPACAKYKNGNSLLTNQGTFGINGTSYDYDSFKNLLEIDRENNKIFVIHFSNKNPDLGISEVSVFEYTNKKQPEFYAGGEFYIYQIIYRNNKGFINETKNFINKKTNLVSQEKETQLGWSDFINKNIPVERLKEGIRQYPQYQIFDKELWKEALANPDIPLYRRYSGFKTSETPPYNSIGMYDNSNNLTELIREYSLNRELLLPTNLRTNTTENKVSAEIVEVSKSEFMPYKPRRR